LSVAQVADYDRLPADFKAWNLKDNEGVAVWEIYRKYQKQK
jgi:hypothetical protein